ncbi:exonuclease domain-containing protein [Azospirillum sp.]|uniref:3'-5' exonuclease n=1 Tax=Azospirillum sp. TaxID=34012 RepID=UPI002D49CE19|nr:exonuclease domain-containing protein [Azospirillum sp.]HYD65068.1 exonuclease domain-containing protein [Azospirillum sp.]
MTGRVRDAADQGPPDPRGRILVIDTEGRGYREDGVPSLCEIAVIELRDGRRTGRVFHTHLDPGAPINPFALAVHGLDEAFLRGQPRFADVAPALLAFFGDAPLVAHGAGGDRAMLDHDLRLAGMAPLAPGRLVCTQRLAARLLKAQYSLDALCDALGIDRSAREAGHGALVDASLTADCFLELARRPGYAAARGVRAFAADRRPAPAVRVRCAIEDGTVAFTVEERATGAVTRLTAPVPPYPADTHVANAGADGVLRITRKGGRAPDNPDGPALLLVRRGRVVAHRFVDGRLLEV